MIPECLKCYSEVCQCRWSVWVTLQHRVWRIVGTCLNLDTLCGRGQHADHPKVLCHSGYWPEPFDIIVTSDTSEHWKPWSPSSLVRVHKDLASQHSRLISLPAKKLRFKILRCQFLKHRKAYLALCGLRTAATARVIRPGKAFSNKKLRQVREAPCLQGREIGDSIGRKEAPELAALAAATAHGSLCLEIFRYKLWINPDFS